MATPWFLDMARVMRAHRSLIETYGGVDGVRDVGLLHSAIAMPQASYGGQYLHADLFELTVSVASGQAGKSEIAQFFRSRAEPSSPENA